MKLGKRRDEAPPEYEVPPEEVYVAEFADYDDPVQSSFKNRDGEYPMRIRLVFAISDDDADEKYQGAKCSMYCDVEVNALNPKSIYHPLLALDPENEPQGGEDLDEFKALKCRISVKHTTKGDKTYANIDKVLPLKRRRGASANGNGKAEPEQRELVGAGAGKKRSAFDVDEA